MQALLLNCQRLGYMFINIIIVGITKENKLCYRLQ